MRKSQEVSAGGEGPGPSGPLGRLLAFTLNEPYEHLLYRAVKRFKLKSLCKAFSTVPTT